MIKKSFTINGRSLILSEINSEKDSNFKTVAQFLNEFYNESDFIKVKTSGSTGVPKLINLKKEHLIASAQKTIEFLHLKKGDRILHCLPTNKIAGLMMLTRWLVGEFDLVLIEPVSNPMEMVSGNFDFAAMIPLQAHQSLDQISRIKKLIIGGGTLDSKLEEEIVHKGIKAYHTYGMTETISHVAMRKLGSNAEFKAMTGVNFDIDDRSCLVIEAPDIGVNGLVTNDVVDLMDIHSFIWKARHDNVINSGGIKHYPEEIEKKIGDVGQAYFISGMVDKALGEKLVLIVEGRKNDKLFKQLEKLDRFERPKQILYLDKFLRTETNKVRRKASLMKALETNDN